MQRRQLEEPISGWIAIRRAGKTIIAIAGNIVLNVVRSCCLLLRYPARARAVANFANSEGCRLSPPSSNQDFCSVYPVPEYKQKNKKQYQEAIYEPGKKEIESAINNYHKYSKDKCCNYPDKLLPVSL